MDEARYVVKVRMPAFTETGSPIEWNGPVMRPIGDDDDTIVVMFGHCLTRVPRDRCRKLVNYCECCHRYDSEEEL